MHTVRIRTTTCNTNAFIKWERNNKKKKEKKKKRNETPSMHVDSLIELVELEEIQ
jgi:hypothetical protein